MQNADNTFSIFKRSEKVDSFQTYHFARRLKVEKKSKLPLGNHWNIASFSEFGVGSFKFCSND